MDNERDFRDLLNAYYRRMIDPSLPLKTRAVLARAWTAWETVLSYMSMVLAFRMTYECKCPSF